MALEYFPCYHSYRKKIAKLSDEDVGRLFRCLLAYSEYGEVEELEGLESIAFDFIADDIDRAKASYEEKCSKNRANAAGRKRSDTSGGESSQTKDKDKSEDKDEDEIKTETEDESKTEDETKDEKNILSRTSSACRDESRRAVEAWNALGLSQITRLSAKSTRYRLLTSRIREHGIDDVLSAIGKIRTSDFLRGQNAKGWVVTFDWFIKPNNFVKVLDGNFDNHGKNDEGGRSGVDWIMNLEL